MAAPMDVCLLLTKAIQNVHYQGNSPLQQMVVSKKTKELTNGDFFVPKGCHSLQPEQLLVIVDEVREAVTKESQKWPIRIRDVKLGTYETFQLFVERQSVYTYCIETVCKEGASYGKLSSGQGQTVLLDLACGSELSVHKDVTLDDLRATVLSQHVQLLLESQGYKAFINLNVDHFSNFDTVTKFLSFDLSKRVSSSQTTEDMKCYKDILICHNCCSKQAKTSSADKKEGNVSLRDSRQTHICESAEVIEKEGPASETDTDLLNADVENITDMQNVSCDFNLKQFIKERGYAVGKNGFDKNLMVCQVLKDEKVSYEVKLAAALDNVLQTVSGSLCLHIVQQNQAFQLQKVHLVLEALSKNPSSFSEFHFVHGPVTHRKEDSNTSELTAEDYFRLRYKQMREAAVMKYGSAVKGDGWERTIQSVTSAGIKFELLSSVARNSLKLDLRDEDDVNISDSRSGSFVMYNCARLATLLSHFQQAVIKGLYPPLPDITVVDFSTLREEAEWCLMFNYVYAYPEVVRLAVEELQPKNSIISKLNTHKICVFLSTLSRSFSSYYSRTHILGSKLLMEHILTLKGRLPFGMASSSRQANRVKRSCLRIRKMADQLGDVSIHFRLENRPHLLPTMYARLYLLKSVHQVMINGLSLLGITALSQL